MSPISVSRRLALLWAISTNSFWSSFRFGLAEQIEHPDHARHRRADFVAHVRDELTLELR